MYSNFYVDIRNQNHKRVDVENLYTETAKKN